MAGQVSGSDQTLLEAIAAGDVPSPLLMGWNSWQAWRRDHGRRPITAVDGYTTSNSQESALWKSAMLEIHGADWAVQVASLEVPSAEVQPQVSGTSLEPATAAGAVPDPAPPSTPR